MCGEPKSRIEITPSSVRYDGLADAEKGDPVRHGGES